MARSRSSWVILGHSVEFTSCSFYPQGLARLPWLPSFFLVLSLSLIISAWYMIKWITFLCYCSLCSSQSISRLLLFCLVWKQLDLFYEVYICDCRLVYINGEASLLKFQSSVSGCFFV